MIGAPAELAGEAAADPALVGFMVTSVRIARTRIQYERTKVVVLHPAMNAVERPFLVALEERVLAAPVGMMGARIQEQRPRVVVFLSAVSAKFAHRAPPFTTKNQTRNGSPNPLPDHRAHTKLVNKYKYKHQNQRAMSRTAFFPSECLDLFKNLRQCKKRKQSDCNPSSESD